ncbi:BnaC03g29760D [Brassica napus]|uniref:Transcription repressor n=2 Tax=Brassica TaxID=3705 RepID=A0A078G8E3_BRANA|nr:probable transcription repressor OFP9 [Brassica napus]CAF1702495.1 unnamed protein product [Brassica napus]CDY21292.1 BnaC03g29760D [Brassica napus]
MKITNRAETETETETEKNKKRQNKQTQNQTRESRICRALCCSNKARLSISSSSSSSVELDRHSNFSDQHCSLSSLTHYMVQEKLEQMIRETQEATHQEKLREQMMRRRRRRSKSSISNTKFIVMMAMEKCSYDPRADFRESMVEMIVANKIREADELRSLLEYYLSMNPREYRSAILEIFYEVCADLFLCS